MTDTTARLAFPMLAVGQAQKEMTHNEALALLDLLVSPTVVAAGTNVPPLTPITGECWIVGPAPTAAWTGRAQMLAGWTDGGWRFAPPTEGMTIWTGGTAGFVRYVGGEWRAGELTGMSLALGGSQVVARRAAIGDPIGGSVIDAEARLGIAAVLEALRGHGLIAR